MAWEDRDWKPNNRPQSTIARTFSADLNDVFKIDENRIDAISGASSDTKDLGQLSEVIEQKKQAVSSQSQELEALEARLRATEERLKQQRPTGASSSTSRAPPTTKPLSSVAEARPSEPTTESTAPLRSASSEHEIPDPRPSAVPAEPRAQPHRQPSDVLPPMPGAMPVTPLEERTVEYVEGRQ